MNQDLDVVAARIRHRLAASRTSSAELNTTSAQLRQDAGELMAVGRDRRVRRLSVPVQTGCLHCGATSTGLPAQALLFLREHPHHCAVAINKTRQDDQR